LRKEIKNQKDKKKVQVKNQKGMLQENTENFLSIFENNENETTTQFKSQLKVWKDNNENYWELNKKNKHYSKNVKKIVEFKPNNLKIVNCGNIIVKRYTSKKSFGDFCLEGFKTNKKESIDVAEIVLNDNNKNLTKKEKIKNALKKVGFYEKNIEEETVNVEQLLNVTNSDCAITETDLGKSEEEILQIDLLMGLVAVELFKK
jgi:hypothetical protein